MMTGVGEQGADRPVDLVEVARMLREVVAVVDQGEVDSPRWLRDRIKAASVTASALAGEPGQATLPIPDR